MSPATEEKICKVLAYILIAAILIIFAPFWILFSPVFAFWWWIEGSIKRDRLAAAKKAVAEARTFEPPPIHQSAHFATDAELEANGCFGEGIPLGYSQESGRQITTPQHVHQMIWGSTGSGKSSSSLIVQLLMWIYSAIVIDSTGELTVTTARQRAKYGDVLIVNPTGMYPEELKGLKQVGINFLSKNWIIPGSNDFEIYAQKIANAIIRRDPSLHDKFWVDSARALLAAAIMTECKYSENPNLANVARMFSRDITGYAASMLQAGFDRDDPWLVDTWSRWGRPGADDMKSLRDVQEHARTDLFPLTLPMVARCLEDDGVDFRSGLFRTQTVYIMTPMDKLRELTPLLRLTGAHGTAQILSQRGAGPIRTKLFIDELYQVHAEELDYGLAANRKFKLDMVLCLNDLQQLQALYPQTYSSMIGSCGVFQVLNVNRCNATAEHVSKLCGKRQVIANARTVNTNPIFNYDQPTGASVDKLGVSDNKSMSTVDLLLPHEVASLGPREQLLWVPGISNPVRCNRKPYFDIPELNRRATANPFYRS